MEDELGGKITTTFIRWRPKTYSYLKDDANGDKIANGTKKCAIKPKRKCKLKNCLTSNFETSKT